jgi:hypothetical protein
VNAARFCVSLSVLCAAVALALACGDSDSANPLALHAGEPNEDDSQLVGFFFREGPCLYVDDGRTRWLPVFASTGTTWDGDEETVTTGELSYAAGTDVVMGGSGPGPGAPVNWSREPAPECEWDMAFLVSQS